MGITTVAELLQHYPSRHEDFTRTVDVVFLQEGAKQTVRVRVETVRLRPTARNPRRPIVEALLSDDSGRMKAIWFNQPFVARKLVEGAEYVLSGKVQRERRGAGLVMMSPAFEQGASGGLHTGRLVPIYPETAGVTSKWLRRHIADAMPTAALMRDEIPELVAARQRLPQLPQAIRHAHFPESEEQAAAARRRIAFRQLLLVQLGVLTSREARARLTAPVLPYDVERARAIRDALPFPLTNAQRKAAHAIFTDMAEPRGRWRACCRATSAAARPRSRRWPSRWRRGPATRRC